MQKDLNFTIHPLHNYVLIRVLTRNQTEGGVILPDYGWAANAGLKVIAVGKDVKEKIQPGDFVIIGGQISVVKDENGLSTEFALVPETSIFAIKKFK